MEVFKSKFVHVYIHELWRLASEIVSKAEFVFNESRIPDSGYMIQVSPEIHSNIIYILINSANIKKLLYTSPHKRKDESKKQFEYRINRSKDLQKLFAEIDISEIKNSKVRNSLEHFDEKLDDINIKFSGSKQDIFPAAAYNMTFSEWKVINPRVMPIRLYISSEKRFYNFNHCIDIGKLHAEASSIISRLKELKLLEQSEKPGGMILLLRQEG